MEIPGGVFRHILTDVGNFQELFPLLFVRLAGSHLPGKSRVSLGVADYGVQHDNAGPPQIYLVSVAAALCSVPVYVLLALIYIARKSDTENFAPA